MSVRDREEERQKNTCPSRGLGLAAAAIGVGVGAALYYFFSKRPENPDGEGSTAAWREEPHSLDTSLHEDSDSYTTISEHSTTDTSMVETESESEMTDDFYSSFESDQSVSSFGSPYNFRIGDLTDSDVEIWSDTEIGDEWEITSSSVDMPEDVRSPMLFFMSQFYIPSPRRQRNRERSWSLEECSICFDVILKDQLVTTLPCTHHFHSDCITPWLQEQATCPNCRKSAE